MMNDLSAALSDRPTKTALFSAAFATSLSTTTQQTTDHRVSQRPRVPVPKLSCSLVTKPPAPPNWGFYRFSR